MQLFIGLPIVGEAARELERVSEPLRLLGEVKLQPSANYHMTLAYLGERPGGDMPALQALLADAARTRAPFSLTLDGLGYFRKGVVYGRVAESAALRELAADVRSALDRLAIRYEPPAFYPHITLARKAPEPPALPVAAIRFAVDRAALYESRKTDAGRRYVPIIECELGELL